ncbi:MAG: protein kinase domain-containing protein [Deltaproteobacteria bacterium]
MSTLDLSPGSLFAGQFRIVRPLAKGGMGAVYVVEQVRTGRERALKLMHPMLVSDAKSIERFEREAQVGSRIDSDHVVEVIAAGVEAAGPTPWLCMELLKGETLADRLHARGVPSHEDLLEIVRQLAHALTAAHRAGIVHRDLKPENIFLSESRRQGVPFTLKVLDFGVATLALGTGDVTGSSTTQGVGSPLWMAPEQTNVGKVVLATDVWALGLIVFNLLTGQPYWRAARTPGSTITALLVEILMEPLDPASVRARELAPHTELPPGFDAWFARCLVRDPGQRFADAAAAMAALFPVLGEAGQTHPHFALGATAYAPRPGDTAPGAQQHPSPEPPTAAPAEAALPRTQPGPSGPHEPAPWHSGPLAASAQPDATQRASASASAPSGPPPAVEKRRVWPYVLLGTFGIGALCTVGVVHQLVRGGQQIARELAVASPNLGGRFVDPRTGTEIEIGPDGVRVQSSEPSSPAELDETIEEEAGETGEGGSHTEGAESEAEETAMDERDPEAQGATDAEGHDASEADEPSASVRRPVVTTRREPDTAEPAALRAVRSRVVDPCWRGTYEGQSAPARARYVVHVSGSSVRVEAPRDTGAQRSFVACVVSRAQGQPDGDYIFMLP